MFMVKAGQKNFPIPLYRLALFITGESPEHCRTATSIELVHFSENVSDQRMLRPIGKVSVSRNILNGSTLFVRQPANQVPLGIVLRACFITIQCKLLFSTKGYQKYTGHYIWKESQECVYPNLSYSI